MKPNEAFTQFSHIMAEDCILSESFKQRLKSLYTTMDTSPNKVV